MDATLFQLDATSGIPFYRQVVDQILAAIATGVLATGDRLPTVRALAVALSINPNTVARAYKELEIRGVLATQQGSGTFVAPQPAAGDPSERLRQLHRLIDDFLARTARLGLAPDELRRALAERLERDV